MKYFSNVSKDLLIEKVSISDSYSMLCRELGVHYYNGPIGKEIKALIKENNLDISHFDGGRKRKIENQTKYEKIIKNCPVCSSKFETLKNSPDEKRTCSYSCSNTLFRSGENNGNYKSVEKRIEEGLTNEKTYREICFAFHEKKCVVCEESLIVSVHHMDENHENNDPENLIPLCPTHHVYWHSSHRHLIEDKVYSYIASRG